MAREEETGRREAAEERQGQREAGIGERQQCSNSRRRRPF